MSAPIGAGGRRPCAALAVVVFVTALVGAWIAIPSARGMDAGDSP